MGLNYRLAPPHNNSNIIKRQSSTSSHSYDDLSDQFETTTAAGGGGHNSNRLACSRNGYAKILPRSNSSKAVTGGGAPDMWAVKAAGQPSADSNSLLLPRFFFQPTSNGYGYNLDSRHSVGSSSLLLGINGTNTAGSGIGERAPCLIGTSRSVASGCNSAPSGKKRNNKYHKIGPRTLMNPPRQLVSPYSRVPIRIDSHQEGEEEEEGGEELAPWEQLGFSVPKPVSSQPRLQPSGLCLGLSSPGKILSLQADRGSSGAITASADGGGSSSNGDIFKSLRRLADISSASSGDSAVRHSGSSCSGGSSTSTTAAELSRLQPPPPPARPISGTDLLEDDAFSNDDYVDMTSDAEDDGDESLDENYKALTDRALDHLTA